MIVTKKSRAGTWCRKLAVVLVFTFIYCSLVTQRAYAEEPKTVLPTTLTVTLQDEDGLPISDVSLAAIDGDFTGKERGSATTDKNGKAVFTHLKSGTYYFFAHLNAIRRHAGYGLPAMIKEFKSSRTFYLSESMKIDLSENVESTYTIKKGAYILFETYLQTVRSGKIIIMNEKNGIEQIIPVASNDYLQIYLPMRSVYKIVTIKDNDFDSWIMEFYAHERLRIELL